MKRIGIILILAVAVCVACNKLKHVDFVADFSSDVTIPKSELNTSSDTIFARDITTNINTILQDNKTRTDLVNSVKLQQLMLTIKSPDAQTFSFARDLRVFAFVEGHSPVEIAHKHSISQNGKELDLDVDDVELKEIILSDVVRVQVFCTNGEAIIADINLDVKVKVKINANLLAI